MYVEIKGAMDGEHFQTIVAMIFVNYLFSCPRHVASHGIGGPPGHNIAGMILQLPGGQMMKRGREQWYTFWS